MRNYAYAYAEDLLRVTLTELHPEVADVSVRLLVTRTLRITLKLRVILRKHNFASSKVLTPYPGPDSTHANNQIR
jgi:hypothetical protein